MLDLEEEPRKILPWWRLYPRESSQCVANIEGVEPKLKVGDLVTIRMRPDRKRRVLNVLWHYHRHEFCYEIQTQKSDLGIHCPAYWFEAQLEAF